MIFVTVGTHEQPFNRLIQKVDFLFSLFFVCSKSGTLLRRWPPTVPESAQQTDRSSHSRTVHPKNIVCSNDAIYCILNL